MITEERYRWERTFEPADGYTLLRGHTEIGGDGTMYALCLPPGWPEDIAVVWIPMRRITQRRTVTEWEDMQ